MYRHYELYRSTSSYSSDNGTFIGLYDPKEDYILVEETRDDYYYAVKAVPYNGVTSERSEWLKAYFHDAIDPDADYSFFESDNFFETTLSWRLTGYESEYKGFQLARLSSGYWRFFSDILPPNHTSYFMNTVPGQSGTYYVIAINKDGTYNNSQPYSQRILQEIPELQNPGSFRGSYYDSENHMELKWNQLSENISWYSGFKIERTSVIPPEENDWNDLIELNGPYHTTYTDKTVTNGIKYMYRIRSFAIPPGGGTPEYSESVSITSNAY
jgi:hypothetical protein